MYVIRLDAKGGQMVVIPDDDDGVVALGQRVLTAQQALAPERRCPYVALLSSRVTAAQAGVLQFKSGKASTSSVSVTVKSALADVKAAVAKIINGLNYHHLHELPVLGEWGVEVVRGGKGNYQVRTPRTQAELLSMLSVYIPKEQSLPDAQRLPDPPLTDVIAKRDALVAALDKRTAAGTEQEQGNLLRTADCRTLVRLLNLIIHHHLVIDFDGVVDARLQSMGFDVVAVPAKAAKPIDPAAPDEAAE